VDAFILDVALRDGNLEPVLHRCLVESCYKHDPLQDKDMR
jgi:hypothetical protein